MLFEKTGISGFLLATVAPDKVETPHCKRRGALKLDSESNDDNDASCVKTDAPPTKFS